MAAVVADLDRVASGGEVEPPRPTASAAGRPRTTLWLAAVGVLAGTAGLLAIDRFTRAPQPAPPQPGLVNTVGKGVTSPPPAPAAPKTVVLHVETTPPGAEIRQGSRVFGAAPRDILLPRSEVPAQLTFHLDGYDDGETQIVPTTDDTLRVKLIPRGRSRHARGRRQEAGDERRAARADAAADRRDAAQSLLMPLARVVLARGRRARRRRRAVADEHARRR